MSPLTFLIPLFHQITTVYNTIGNVQNQTLQTFATQTTTINSISTTLNLTTIQANNLSSLEAAETA